MQYDEDGPEMPFVKWFSTSWTSTIEGHLRWSNSVTCIMLTLYIHYEHNWDLPIPEKTAS